MLTKAQRRVLEQLAAGGRLLRHLIDEPMVLVLRNGMVWKVRPATVMALARREWTAPTRVACDEAMEATITDAGRAALTRP